MTGISTENLFVAERLREASQLLSAQGANPYRVNAYRDAADSIAHLPRDVRKVYEREGVRGLDAIPRVGLGIASAVAEMLVSRHWSQLDRLRGEACAVTVFQSIPGIGPALARRIHQKLQVETLEALESAANDGRLEGVPGVGARRAAAIRATLAEMLGRIRSPAARRQDASLEPTLALLLEVDGEYRHKSATGELTLITPRRFNLEGAAWLPVMHCSRGPWHFTALYSNTALAHRLGRTRDWVVVYFYDGDEVERQRTVVTEHHGPLAGRRVVRGRELECRQYYAAH